MSKPVHGRGKGGSGGKTRGHMSDDDSAVWEHTARSLVPLKKSKPRVHPAISDDDPAVLFAPKPSTQSKRHSPTGHAAASKAAHIAAVPRTKVAPDLQTFDVKRARRLKSGRTEIEARIDLHGMKQVEAHAALRRFLLSCHGNGLRTVLVITGKGGTAGAQRADDENWVSGHERGVERGVLKRNVPRWLAEPELRRVVVSYTSSAIRHGGEGALYVHLRSANKIDDRD